MMFSVKGITVQYGKVAAARNVSFDVQKGSVIALIGGNGAGKTTVLKAISGLQQCVQGEITFEGNAINGFSPQEIVKLGISHVPEGRKLFAKMGQEYGPGPRRNIRIFSCSQDSKQATCRKSQRW
jgi:branched-chain amino acid transport system ATP-binding protein